MTFRPEGQIKLVGGGKGKSQALDWLKAHVSHDGPECLVWPFGYDADGYGTINYDGRAQSVGRVMCELVNGPMPEDKQMAAHNCGNGHRGCVHPKHVEWKSWKENAADRKAHGRQATGRRGHLTPEMVEEMRTLRDYLPQREIAIMFGTTRANVGHIFRGQTFKSPHKGVSKRGNSYIARVKPRGGKTIYLGTFDTLQDAVLVYQTRLDQLMAAERKQ
jgi:hypothetical protein